jgi:D-tyrosyl-tRNA(Tyr) deacylase
VIQRVERADVTIDGESVAAIGAGLAVLVGVETGDGAADAEWLAEKIVRMRIFADDQGRMNRSVQEAGGGVLVVSQFTLHAATQKGNRPSFLAAARPEEAVGRSVPRGVFGADMRVSLVNDGPVTILVDSRRRQ